MCISLLTKLLTPTPTYHIPHTHIHTYIHTYTYTHIHIHTHTHTHTHSCMDSTYSLDPDRKAEYSRADELKLDLIPALIDDYDIKSFSSWWPLEMPFLEQHRYVVIKPTYVYTYGY
jgi:hypothetical protein